MTDYRTQQKDILRTVRSLPRGNCPHFFLYSKVLEPMEQLALHIADAIAEEQLIPFHGSVKQFSIHMPYLDDSAAAEKFLNRLKESISIARDFYNRYEGILILECDSTWGRRGACSALNSVLNLLRANSGICCIVLLPEIPSSCPEKIEDLYRELSACGIWLQYHLEAIEYGSCTKAFLQMATAEGLTVSQEVLDALDSRLASRDQSVVDNKTAVQQLFRQVCLHRQVGLIASLEIAPQEITLLSGCTAPKKRNRIGFSDENR